MPLTARYKAPASDGAGVEVLRYPSARDLGPPGGTNLAVLACRRFASRAPVERQTWRIDVGAAGIRAVCASPEVRLGLARDALAADPRIAKTRSRGWGQVLISGKLVGIKT